MKKSLHFRGLEWGKKLPKTTKGTQRWMFSTFLQVPVFSYRVKKKKILGVKSFAENWQSWEPRGNYSLSLSTRGGMHDNLFHDLQVFNKYSGFGTPPFPSPIIRYNELTHSVSLFRNEKSTGLLRFNFFRPRNYQFYRCVLNQSFDEINHEINLFF